jgi:transposase
VSTRRNLVRRSHQPAAVGTVRSAPAQAGWPAATSEEETAMDVQYARCCGLDVHQKTVVACVLVTAPDGTVQRTVHTFGTMTADLLALNDWLNAQRVEQVALESTGVYWRPVFNLLEADHAIILVNAQHLKRVPGHKTDVKDSEWLADLLRHGLLQASFIPPQPIRELRELTRYRKTLVQERQQEINRLHKVLESANLKLGAVASDVLGLSGRARARRRCWRASRTPTSWPSWRAAACGPNCRRCVWRWRGG